MVIPLNQMVLKHKVCGDTLTNVGEDFIVIFLLRAVWVLLSFFGTIVGVSVILHEISSLLFICLL